MVVIFFMAPFFQMLEPPRKPGRFTACDFIWHPRSKFNKTLVPIIFSYFSLARNEFPIVDTLNLRELDNDFHIR
jgi:hypothetical protein